MHSTTSAPGHRVCSAAFFDLDNTLIGGSSLFHLGWGGFKRGMFSSRQMFRFTVEQLFFRLTRKEWASATETWGNFGAAYVKGAEVAALARFGREVIAESIAPALRGPVLAMARRHLSAGEEVWIVTASPHEVSQMLAESLGFTGGIGTRAEVRDGRYTGRLPAGVLHGPRKAQAVVDLAGERGIDLARSSAYSDSINDLPLLLAVGFPQAVAPDRQLARLARQRGWPVHQSRSYKGLLGLANRPRSQDGVGLTPGGIAPGTRPPLPAPETENPRA
jgi:HAD superfamily hydrolase (TIGR01490 family)